MILASLQCLSKQKPLRTANAKRPLSAWTPKRGGKDQGFTASHVYYEARSGLVQLCRKDRNTGRTVKSNSIGNDTFLQSSLLEYGEGADISQRNSSWELKENRKEANRHFCGSKSLVTLRSSSRTFKKSFMVLYLRYCSLSFCSCLVTQVLGRHSLAFGPYRWLRVY